MCWIDNIGMTLKYSFKTALIGLKTHRSRSLLTILGIVIGISAIILVMSVGQGAEELILNQVRAMGAETIIVEPGREPQGPSDFAEILTDSLKEKDLEALKNPANVRGLKEIEPVEIQMASIIFENETKRATLRGGTDLIFKMFDLYPDEGVLFGPEEIKQASAVAVLGSKVKEELFGFSQAAGQRIKIKNRTFTVIGTLPPKGQLGFLDVDNMVLTPYTSAQKYLASPKHYNMIMIQAESEDVVMQTADDIKLTLRENHGITDPEKDDFHMMTQADIISRVSAISTILAVLLVSVAAISLVVGGIGIMNIMLVSVTERTKEIGLRKALGATEKNILTQFLLEAITLTGLGGILGIILGSGFAFLASFILSHFLALDWVFVVPFSAIFLGLGVSTAIGLTFGIYPARQASLKSPIEALRYE